MAKEKAAPEAADIIGTLVVMRYRIQGGKLTFHYKMYRQGETLQIAFDKAVKSISESLGADVLMGNPS